jgi:hypothetical protein
MKIDPLYVNPHQARQREPTQYETLLGDAMERAFGQGLWELDQLVGYLNQSGPLAPNGHQWSEASFAAELKRMANA